MSYPNGILNAPAAAELPYKVKAGLVVNRQLIDDSKPNNWIEYEDNAAGTARIHYLIGADANNITQLANPSGVNAMALSITQLATPATPTITNVGTAGSTTDAYKIVAKSGAGATLGTTPASAAGSTTTANATLSATNYNVITFAKVAGAVSYDIYRTTAAGTPSTTGKIGTVLSTNSLSTGIQTATYTFNDTGIAADGITAPTVNTTGVVNLPLGGSGVVALTTPANVAVAVSGTAGATSYSYKIVAKNNAGSTAASTAGSTTTGNATLSTTNFNTITWNPVPGALSYDVYRTVGGASQGLIGNVLSTATLSFNDTGLTGDASTAPTVNTSGQVGAVLSVSSNVITPTNPIHHLGAGLVKTITVPGFMAGGGTLQIIPDAAFTYDNTGNIVVPSGGGTATVNKLMTLVWDTAKWTPSY